MPLGHRGRFTACVEPELTNSFGINKSAEVNVGVEGRPRIVTSESTDIIVIVSALPSERDASSESALFTEVLN